MEEDSVSFGDCFVVYEVGLERGDDSLSRGFLVLKRHDVAFWNTETEKISTDFFDIDLRSRNRGNVLVGVLVDTNEKSPFIGALFGLVRVVQRFTGVLQVSTCATQRYNTSNLPCVRRWLQDGVGHCNGMMWTTRSRLELLEKIRASVNVSPVSEQGHLIYHAIGR